MGPPCGAIPDQSLDTGQSSIALIGKGSIGYAEFWNQNLLSMLANFASVSSPRNPLIGQLWFDKSHQGLRLQVGIGARDADADGWSTRLATSDSLAGMALVFTDNTSDIVVPATGTVAAPPALILKNVNASVAANTVGTFNTLSVNAKGLVVSARNAFYITDMVVSGDVSGASHGTAIVLPLATVNATPGIFNAVTVNSKGLVTAASNAPYLTGNQSITITGDVAGTGSTDI